MDHSLDSFHDDGPGGRRIRSLLHTFFCFLVLATLANGLHFWLQKSRILPSAHLIEQMAEIIESGRRDPAAKPTSIPVSPLEPFYRIPHEWRFTKVLKDFFCVTFVIVSLLLWQRPRLVARGPAITMAALGLSIAIAGLYSAWTFGPWVALTGMRPFVYLVAGLAGVWAAQDRPLALLSRYLVAILLIELALGLYEHANGFPLFNTARWGNRIAGTFSFPSSLGIFAVISGAFAASFSTMSRPLLLALIAVLVYLTGSATALVLLSVSVALWLLASVPTGWRPAIRIASLSVIAALLLMMPKLVARQDVMDSLWARAEVAADYFHHWPGTTQALFGKGLGIGSNVLTSAVIQAPAFEEPESVDLHHARADSTPMALINQIGIVGAGLFYLLLGMAAWQDRLCIPACFLIALASLATNVLELFPVNFLLGLLLCRSLLQRTQGMQSADGAHNRLPDFR